MSTVNLLKQIIMACSQDAENQFLAQQLPALETLCNGVATRFNCDAEELISEGYVHLVSEFRQMIDAYRHTANNSSGGWAAIESSAADIPNKLTQRLTLQINIYAAKITDGKRHIPTLPVDELVGSKDEPVHHDSCLERAERPAISDTLIQPFITIANCCRKDDVKITLPTDDPAIYKRVRETLMREYKITSSEAEALLESYGTYVNALINSYLRP